MRSLVLVSLVLFSLGASSQSLFTHQDDGRFIYRGYVLHVNKHARKLLIELLAHKEGESDEAVGLAMDWENGQTRDRIEHLVGNINHVSLRHTGARLLRHEPRSKKDTSDNRLFFDMRARPSTEASRERLRELLLRSHRETSNELIVRTEDFEFIGLPLEGFRREINAQISGDTVFRQLTVELPGETYRARLIEASFGKYSPSPLPEDCETSVKGSGVK